MSGPLALLAARETDVAPYDFAEFQRRAVECAARPPVRVKAVRVLRRAAMIAPLALGLGIAGVERHGVVIERADAAPVREEPALVRASAAARVEDLEDRIAWLDSLISEASALDLAAPDRAALKSGRDTLADSLQRVRYAQSLLTY
jgi:hypothetical protein